SLTDTATSAFSTLSLHDALPIWGITVNAIAPGLVGTSRSMLSRPDQDREEVLAQWASRIAVGKVGMPEDVANAVSFFADERTSQDRKSTRLNSSHVKISYAVFCL